MGGRASSSYFVIPAQAGIAFNTRQSHGQATTLRLHAGEQEERRSYIGVTSDLIKRVWQHKNDVVEGYTHRYGIHTLVWYELHPMMESAILREKSLKGWKRAWKIRLVESENASWSDLYDGRLSPD